MAFEVVMLGHQTLQSGSLPKLLSPAWFWAIAMCASITRQKGAMLIESVLRSFTLGDFYVARIRARTTSRFSKDCWTA
jgi:hypothetical protein